MSIETVLKEVRQTNVTETVHAGPYEAISPTRAELNQAGRNILITGGGTGVGLAIAKAFVQASASTVIIVGRRADVLETARKSLEDEAKSRNTDTKVIARSCDVGKTADIDELWEYFAGQKMAIDVFVANAAVFQEAGPMLALGTEQIWNMMEINVKGPMYLAEKFVGQPNDNQKFIVHVSTGNVAGTGFPAVGSYLAYTMSKLSATLYFQYISQELAHEKVQILNFHPGPIYNEYWKSMGLGVEHFDDDRLPGQFAVWAATKEAAFLHGRMTWSSWDVEELAQGDVRKRIDEDFYFLKGTIAGLELGMLA